MAEKKYINVEAAKDYICERCGSQGHCNRPELCPFMSGLDNIPAADVRPVVRGRWKLGGYGQISDATEKWYDQFLTGGFLYCSICKARTSVKFNFCPNCGADMRGGDAE